MPPQPRRGATTLTRGVNPWAYTTCTMKTHVLIETHTTSAYRAIRPAIVAANVGTFGVCGLTISATIKQSDYAYLVDVVNHAAQSAGIPRDEYDIKTVHAISR